MVLCITDFYLIFTFVNLDPDYLQENKVVVASEQILASPIWQPSSNPIILPIIIDTMWGIEGIAR